MNIHLDFPHFPLSKLTLAIACFTSSIGIDMAARQVYVDDITDLASSPVARHAPAESSRHVMQPIS